MIHEQEDIEEQYTYELPAINESWNDMHSEILTPMHDLKIDGNERAKTVGKVIWITFSILGFGILFISSGIKMFLAILLIYISFCVFVQLTSVNQTTSLLYLSNKIDTNAITTRKVIARSNSLNTLDLAAIKNEINNT